MLTQYLFWKTNKMSVSLTVSELRTRFSEFSDQSKFPDDLLQNGIDLALIYANKLWGNIMPDLQLPLAQYLSAHNVVIDDRARKGDTDSVSPIDSKKLGDAEVKYQSANATSDLTSTLNATIYGQRVLNFLRISRVYSGIAVVTSG